MIDVNFPFELFSCVDKQHINRDIELGGRIASTKTITFVGIAKDAAPHIERNIVLAKRTGELFKDYSIYIYENDSSDNTVEILQRHADDHLSFDSETRPDLEYVRDNTGENGDPYHYKRSEKIAAARGAYTNREYNTDYVCVIDWDMKGGWWIEGFISSLVPLEYLDSAACVSAYGVLGEMHGTVPLEDCKPEQRLMFDCFAFRPLGAPERTHITHCGRWNFIKTSIGQPPVEVHSNFNGVAIYHAKTFNNYHYSAKHWDDVEEGCVDCDHVCLHRDMRNDGHKIYMVPNMLTSHSPHRYSL